MSERRSVKKPQEQARAADAVEVSAEGAVQREVAELSLWLSSQGIDLALDPPGKGDASREGVYWRFGYCAGLKHALEMLTRQGATLH